MTVSLSEKNMAEISKIRELQGKLYSNMDRFTAQVILAYMHNSPMNVEGVFNIQSKINKNITKNQVKGLLEDLVDLHFAKHAENENEYEPTEESLGILKAEGITEEFLFTKD